MSLCSYRGAVEGCTPVVSDSCCAAGSILAEGAVPSQRKNDFFLFIRQTVKLWPEDFQ